MLNISGNLCHCQFKWMSTLRFHMAYGVQCTDFLWNKQDQRLRTYILPVKMKSKDKQTISPVKLKSKDKQTISAVKVKSSNQQTVSAVTVKSNDKETVENDSLSTDGDYRILYRFPAIKFVRFISRIKIYQIVFMSALCYPLYFSYIDDAITKTVFHSAIGGCVGTTLLFIAFSYFSTKVIGQLAVNKNGDMLKISTLTFYGYRKDYYYNVADIIPWMDVNITQEMGPFQRVNIRVDEKTDHVFIYSLRHGNVYDSELFSSIMGLPSD